jgi:hypothetical protein
MKRPSIKPLFDLYVGFEHAATYQTLNKAMAALQRRAGIQDVRAGNVVVKRAPGPGVYAPRKLFLADRTSKTPQLVRSIALGSPTERPLFPRGFLEATGLV